MKNNSMAELQNAAYSSNKISKPPVNLRNSMNGPIWETSTNNSPSKNLMKDMRSGSIDAINTSVRLLNRDELMSSPLSPAERAKIVYN